MTSIPLRLVPLDPVAQPSGRSGAIGYPVTSTDLEFEVEGLDTPLPHALYRLEIDTPDAAGIRHDTYLMAAGDGGSVPLRVVVEARTSTVRIYFVPLAATRHLRLVLSIRDLNVLSLGDARLKRVSTTAWRVRQHLKGSGQRFSRLFSPTAPDASLWSGYRSGGMREARRRISRSFSPEVWRPLADVEMRIANFAPHIAKQNAAALREIGPANADDAGSLSIVIPIFRVPEAWLRQLVDSLDRQTDQDFEVVFVFDGPQPELADAVDSHAKGAYRRILVTLPDNRGVSAATNAGIERSGGDYIVVVDHDDALESRFVEAFHRASASEAADIYYGDEVVTDGDMHAVTVVASRGRFDVRHYLSHPYIVHPIFIRRAVVAAAGGLDPALSISQDIDFFLRCLAASHRVVQIPLVLYYWRRHASSLGFARISEVGANTKRAIRSYLAACTDWSAFDVRDGVNFNEFDVRPPLPPRSSAAVIVDAGHDVRALRACLASIEMRRSLNEVPLDIYVIERCDADAALSSLLAAERAAGRIVVVKLAQPANHAQANNAAAGRVDLVGRHSHLVFMSSAVELVTDDWLDRLVALFSWGDVGVVGCCLDDPNGRVHHAGVVVGLTGTTGHTQQGEPARQWFGGNRSPGDLSTLVATKDYSAVTSALMVVPRDVFRAVAGFDECLDDLFDGTDLCLRIGSGGSHSVYVGGVVGIHRGSDVPAESPATDDALFASRYRDLIRAGDPYHGMQWDRGTPQRKWTKAPTGNFAVRATDVHKPDQRS